jgi:2-polyprenyl-3-methyl-5-hydroxy-6-metoxy-1,4-benzoquinol methylase
VTSGDNVTGYSEKDFFYEKNADLFEVVVDMFDTDARVRAVFQGLGRDVNWGEQSVLEVGAGLGFFSREAARLGANVTASDVGPSLLSRLNDIPEVKKVVCHAEDLPFLDNSFGVVLCSEVLEHVRNQEQSLSEIARVLQPGGLLLITTPNSLWKWTLFVARILRLRPYQGREDWSTPWGLLHKLETAGFTVEMKMGIHIIPFVIHLVRPLINSLVFLEKPFWWAHLNLAIAARRAGR